GRRRPLRALIRGGWRVGLLARPGSARCGVAQARERGDDRVAVGAGPVDGVAGHQPEVAVAGRAVRGGEDAPARLAELVAGQHEVHDGLRDDHADRRAEALPAVGVDDADPAAVEPAAVELLQAALQADAVVGAQRLAGAPGAHPGAEPGLVLAQRLVGDRRVDLAALDGALLVRSQRGVREPDGLDLDGVLRADGDEHRPTIVRRGRTARATRVVTGRRLGP